MTDSADAKGKLPAFQFYTKDWREDLELQSCSLAAQGLWINALCIAHQAKPYGHLVINGKPMTTPQIANAVGVSLGVCKKLLDELHDAGVTSIADNGAIYSRRMARDQQRRDRLAEQGRENGHKGAEHGRKGAEFGKLGGRPRKAQPGEENGGEEPGQKPPQNPLPSSPSATASPEERTPPHVPELAAVAPGVGTPKGEISKALRHAGIPDINGDHPTYTTLLAAGATASELVALVPLCVGKAKPFLYLLEVAVSNRQKAAKQAETMHRGSLGGNVQPDNPDVAATQKRLQAEASRTIAKPPADLRQRLAAVRSTTGETS